MKHISQHCSNLEVLDLRNNTVTNEIIRTFAKCKAKIKVLKLFLNSNMDTLSFSELVQHWHSLNSIRFATYQCDRNCSYLEMIAQGNPNLHTLELLGYRNLDGAEGMSLVSHLSFRILPS